MSSINLLILLGIWLASLTGLIFIAYKKWPHLQSVPAPDTKKIIPNLKRIRDASLSFRKVFPDKLLHKMLLRFHILILKCSNKTGEWLEQLRNKSRSRGDKEIRKDEDRYWEELKKTAKK